MRSYTSKKKFELREDNLLTTAVRVHGTSNWSLVALAVPGRSARQCRERWNNYVNPNLHNEAWTDQEDSLLLEKFRELGPKWHRIAKYFEGRARNKVRNRIFALQHRGLRDTDFSHARAIEGEITPLTHQDVEIINEKSVLEDPFAFLDVTYQDCEISWYTALETEKTSSTFF
jgi:hypothetical protein